MDGYAITYPISTTFKTPLDVKDSINLTYTSQWSAANLTVLCVPDAGNVYNWYNMPDNPQAPIGNYVLPSFEVMGFKITVYPAGCIVRLTQYRNDSKKVDSPKFFLTSSATASAKTYGPSTTLGLPSTSSASQSTTLATTTNTSGSTTATATDSIPTATSTSGASSQGISKGTAAGIGVGAALGALLMIGAIVLWIWCARKRKRRQPVANAHITSYDKAELYTPACQGLLHSSGKSNHYTRTTQMHDSRSSAGLEASRAQAEMDGSGCRHEVSGVSSPRYYDPPEIARKPVGQQRHELSG